MVEVLSAVLRWLVPALIVLAVVVLVVFVVIGAVRLLRRSTWARTRAAARRDEAGRALVQLDDAVAEFDIEVGLSGALFGGESAAPLRRARMTAQHARDRAFADYRAISADTASPGDVRRGSARVRRRAENALAAIDGAQRRHAEWMREHMSAPTQVAQARGRLDDVRARLGDPGILLDDLRRRFDASECADAEAAATRLRSALDAADAHLARASEVAADPSRSALEDLARAERAIRRADDSARALEEEHRAVVQASVNLPAEREAAREAVQQALALRRQLDPDAAARLGEAIRAVSAGLDALDVDAGRRPGASVAAITRLRDRLDLAQGDARTTQQRLRSARTALAGTLATARRTLAHAEASGPFTTADARARIDDARRDLAAARQTTDPVEALDLARRSMRSAEDAAALAAYQRLS